MDENKINTTNPFQTGSNEQPEIPTTDAIDATPVTPSPQEIVNDTQPDPNVIQSASPESGRAPVAGPVLADNTEKRTAAIAGYFSKEGEKAQRQPFNKKKLGIIAVFAVVFCGGAFLLFQLVSTQNIFKRSDSSGMGTDNYAGTSGKTEKTDDPSYNPYGGTSGKTGGGGGSSYYGGGSSGGSSSGGSGSSDDEEFSGDSYTPGVDPTPTDGTGSSHGSYVDTGGGGSSGSGGDVIYYPPTNPPVNPPGGGGGSTPDNRTPKQKAEDMAEATYQAIASNASRYKYKSFSKSNYVYNAASTSVTFTHTLLNTRGWFVYCTVYANQEKGYPTHITVKKANASSSGFTPGETVYDKDDNSQSTANLYNILSQYQK